MSIVFTGLQSVLDRTLFTHKGPIAKPPLPLVTGVGLTVLSPDTVLIPSGTFTESNVGHVLEIVGSPDGRNDGRFPVDRVLSGTRLKLKGASFDLLDFFATEDRIVALVNDLKRAYNLHRTQKDVHGTHDTFNPVTGNYAVDFPSALLLVNEIRTKLAAHMSLVGPDPSTHIVPDLEQVGLPVAHDMASILLLVNALRRTFEAHRQNLEFHLVGDTVNRVNVKPVKPVLGSGPTTGPFNWTLLDPRLGQVADDPSDVSVKVNGTPVSIDAVFGLLGAVVLTGKPGPSDSVSIDYGFVSNFGVQLQRLNSPEFGLNQFGNGNLAGLPQHKYRSRSYLLDVDRVGQKVSSPFQPKRIGWKYKAFQRAYTATLNDPNTLLLNVPSNKVSYPVLFETVRETTVRYDPSTLPQNATDPWILEGVGNFSLAPGGSELTVVDLSSASGPGSRPPFFTHSVNLQFDCITSAAFRAKVDVDETSHLLLDGANTGVGFGLSDGGKVALFGFIMTKATNLSSAISLANALKAQYNSHLVLTGTHRPNDAADGVDVVNAKDLQSLIILLNRVKLLYNVHIAKGPVTVHQEVDTVNGVTLADAEDEATAIALTNELYDKYNAHLSQFGVHYVNDTTNVMVPSRQVGILTNRGYPEFDTSWNSFAVDWTQYVTYRIQRSPNGKVSLFLSGFVDPICTVEHEDLPATSVLDLRIDLMQQVFFGSVGTQSTSTSRWNFVRCQVTPLDANQLADNKSVGYFPAATPELDPTAPWITVGQHGYDRVLFGNFVSDSTASADPSVVDDLGLTTGAYKGYLRLEPILSDTTTCVVEFQASLGYWTHSLDNRAAGVFLDDGLFSTHFVFLQSTPTPATVTGTSPEPYGIAADDILIIAFANQLPKTIQFLAPVTTAAGAATVINEALGFDFASVVSSGSPASNFIRFTDQVLGATSKFQLVGGDALTKLGLSPGTFFGKDSNAEPKVSWFGEDFPDFDFPRWSRAGDQVSELLNRTLRITDTSTSDYRAYVLADSLFTAPVMGAENDWKCDFRMQVLAVTPGDQVATGTNLRFAGALVNLDEGPLGKNVEVQLAMDHLGHPFLNVLSYDASTNTLQSIMELPFNWNDGKVHSYNVYTSKAADLMLVLADNVVLGTFAYSALRTGFNGPAVSFGSGSGAVANGDLTTAMSSVDWSSVCVFKDGKVSDPLAPERRYVGVYGGGDPSLLSSYYVHQIDWTVPHTYRLVRDPVHGVTVFVDGGDVPVISINYDPLKLPPSSSSFLKGVTEGRHSVAFGGFNPFEISRTIWNFLRYSLGKITLTDRVVPAHQVVNQANVVTSPEHLRTKVPHAHHGFQVYSGGTPLDDFLADPNLKAMTELSEGMPPVPLTQDLETRGGLRQAVTPASFVPTAQFVNTRGFLSDFENDADNVVSHPTAIIESAAIPLFIARVNDLRNRFNLHIVQPGVHYVNDVANQIETAPAINLAEAVALTNEVKAKLQAHFLATPSHAHADGSSFPSVTAVDLQTGVLLIENLAALFARLPGWDPSLSSHIESSDYHLAPDARDVITLPDAITFPQALSILTSFKAKYNAHRSQPGVHVPDDPGNQITSSDPFDFDSANNFLVEAYVKYDTHLATGGGIVHVSIDPANVFGSPYPPYTDTAAVTEAANRLKRVYNQHIVQPGLHYADDAYNAVTVPDIETMTIVVTVLNQLKAQYNVHIGDPLYHVPDAFNAVTAADAVDYDTAVTLANEMKVKFNLHFAYTVAHLLPDALDFVVEPNAIDVQSLLTLSQALKSRYEAHRQQPGVHGHDDPSGIGSPVATDLVSAISLLNSIKAAYELHRVDTLYHGAPDVLHVITTPDAVDLFTAVQLASDLRGNINAHFLDPIHVVRDSTNTIVSGASDVPSLIAIANEMRADLLAHFTQIQMGVVSLHVHGNSDNVHVVTAASVLGTLIGVLESYKAKYNAHRTYRVSGSPIHRADDVYNPLIKDANYRLASPETFETASVVDFAVDCAVKNNLHIIQSGVHHPIDQENFIPPIVSTGPEDIEYAVEVGNSLKQHLNDHIRGVSFHKVGDLTNNPTASSARDPLQEAYDILLALKTAHNEHVVRIRSHVKVDPESQVLLPNPDVLEGGFLEPDPEVVSRLIAIANRLKVEHNLHRLKPDVHVTNDTVNEVVAPDAVDIESLGNLVNDLLSKHNAHLSQGGVHGSSVFIRLDPPNRVLYNSLKAFKDESGVEGLLQSFSDDDTLYMRTLSQTRPHSLSYEGGTAPERVTFVNYEVEPYHQLVDGDTITVKMDDGPTDSYELQSSDIYAADVAERINIEACRLIINEIREAYNRHLVEPGVHATDDTVNGIVLPPALDLLTSIALANQIRFHYNYHHRVEPGVHDFDDVYNSVGAGYAFNLDQLIDLCASLRLAFNNHKKQPYLHIVDDTVNVITRTGGGFAKDNGDGRVRFTSPTPGPSSSIIVAGPASVKLGFDVPQFTPWVIKSSNETDVQVLPVLGNPDYLNYGTIPATDGSQTTYKNVTGLTDVVSMDIDVTVSIRIHNAYIDDRGDSNIYVGMNGMAGPGFSVAIGFEVDVVSGGCYVKLQDLKANRNVFKRLFNWNDGQFHTYRVLRDAETNSMNLMVVE